MIIFKLQFIGLLLICSLFNDYFQQGLFSLSEQLDWRIDTLKVFLSFWFSWRAAQILHKLELYFL